MSITGVRAPPASRGWRCPECRGCSAVLAKARGCVRVTMLIGQSSVQESSTNKRRVVSPSRCNRGNPRSSNSPLRCLQHPSTPSSIYLLPSLATTVSGSTERTSRFKHSPNQKLNNTVATQRFVGCIWTSTKTPAEAGLNFKIYSTE